MSLTQSSTQPAGPADLALDAGAPGRSGADAPAPPAQLATIATRVERHLDALFDREEARWRAVDAELVTPLVSLRRLTLQGGKRLRPAFCFWGFVAAGGDDQDPSALDRVDAAGAAFELLHAFALIHDDVMDDADRRRGTPTAHVEYAGLHQAGAWRGETRRFGESVAILIGDLAHVYADGMMEQVRPDPEALVVWRELQAELMMGQFLDVMGTARADRSPHKASLIAQLKSGRYTIERPLQLGAALTGAPPAVQAVLNAYGAPLGEAFQLRDDVLGAVGSPDTVGKPVGGDLREGKPTPILAHAVAQATPAQRARLTRVGTPDLTDDDIVELQDILVATGALRAVESRIAALTTQAVAAIDADPVPPAARRSLVELAQFIAAREH